MNSPITTIDVCAALNLTEPALRHLLRRPGAPRPALQPSARVFLWTEGDLDALRTFVEAGAKRGLPSVRDTAESVAVAEGGA